MLIEIKSKELASEETIKLIKHQIFLANRVEKTVSKEAITAICDELKGLSEIAESLTSIEQSISDMCKSDIVFAANIPIIISHKNLIIIVWNEIVDNLIKLFTMAGNIAIEENELKEICWKDIKTLAKAFSSSLSFM